MPADYDRSVALSPRILRRAFTFFHTISRFRHLSRHASYRAIQPCGTASRKPARTRVQQGPCPTDRQSRQSEFRRHRHPRRAARAVLVHAAQLPGGSARQGQAHAGVGSAGGQRAGAVHADGRAALAGFRHRRRRWRDARGARGRCQAAGQRGGGQWPPRASGGRRAGRRRGPRAGASLRIRQGQQRRNADPRVPAEVRERGQSGAGAAPHGAAQQPDQRLSRQQHAGGHGLRR